MPGGGGTAGGRSGRARREGGQPPPRRRRRQADAARQERIERQRAAAERGNRNWIVGGVVAVILVVIGIIAFGIYQTQIKPLNKTVLRVGEIEYSLAHLERRMRLLQMEDPTFAQPGQHLLQMPDIVLDELEEEATLLEAASTLEITVTEEEIDNEIRERGGLPEDVEANAFAEEFRRQVDESPLHTDEYRQYLRATLLREKVTDYFVFLAPPTELQVRSRWIVADNEEDAEAALERLDAGEAFADVARDVNAAIDPSSAERGGLVEWRPRGAFPLGDIEEFLYEEAARREYSEVLPAGGRFYIVQLLNKDEDRELDSSDREVVADREMADWLASQIGTLDIVRDLSAEDANRALEDVL